MNAAPSVAAGDVGVRDNLNLLWELVEATVSDTTCPAMGPAPIRAELKQCMGDKTGYDMVAYMYAEVAKQEEKVAEQMNMIVEQKEDIALLKKRFLKLPPLVKSNPSAESKTLVPTSLQTMSPAKLVDSDDEPDPVSPFRLPDLDIPAGKKLISRWYT
jgi:hypothetical protein